MQCYFMYNYDTVVEALNDLRSRGYLYDFNLRHENPYSFQPKHHSGANQLKIKETYRFEGNTDPADQAIVYALASEDGLKGIFVNGYGIYADTESDSLLRHLEE